MECSGTSVLLCTMRSFLEQLLLRITSSDALSARPSIKTLLGTLSKLFGLWEGGIKNLVLPYLIGFVIFRAKKYKK